MTEKIGIIAGGGNLPHMLAFHLQAQRIPFFLLCIQDQDQTGSNFPYTEISIGRVQQAIDIFKREQVKLLVFIGRIKRPSIFKIELDIRGLLLLLKLLRNWRRDDALLRTVIAEFEGEGFKVQGIEEWMPHLLTSVGLIAGQSPNQQDFDDMKFGFSKLKENSKLDRGQALIVRGGKVLRFEDIRGTDHMIGNVNGGILIKAPKHGQELRIDRPTIGVETIRNASQSGLKGIAVSAGQTLIADLAETKLVAQELGIFIYGYQE